MPGSPVYIDDGDYANNAFHDLQHVGMHVRMKGLKHISLTRTRAHCGAHARSNSYWSALNLDEQTCMHGAMASDAKMSHVIPQSKQCAPDV